MSECGWMIQEDVEATAGSPSRASAVGTVNWGTATLVGVFAGLLYGGSREASASVVSYRSTLLSLPHLLFYYSILARSMIAR